MADRSFVDVDRGPIEYELTVGDPDLVPLVFLHEGLGSIDLWRGFPDDVRSACGDPTMLVYARHGYGRSAPAASPRPVSYMHHEADVVLPELLDRLAVERPLLVGHSDGASIALLYAGVAGVEARVSGIVALAPHVFVEDETIGGIEAARTAFESTDLRAKLGRYHHDPVATFRGWNDVWLSDEFRHWNIEDRLPHVEVPILLVQGTADDYGTLAQLDAIELGVRGRCARLVLDGAGHAPHVDARAEVVAAIGEFAASINRPA